MEIGKANSRYFSGTDLLINGFVGVDISSSSVKVFLFSNEGNYIQETNVHTDNNLTPGAFTVLLCEVVSSLSRKFSIKCLLLAIPATIDFEGKRLLSSNVLKDWDKAPITEWLEIRLKINVFLLKKESFLALDHPKQYFVNSNNIKDFISKIN